MKKEKRGSGPKSIFGLTFLRASTCGINTTGEYCAGNTEQSHFIPNRRAHGCLGKRENYGSYLRCETRYCGGDTGKKKVRWRVKESGSGPYDYGDVGAMHSPSGM